MKKKRAPMLLAVLATFCLAMLAMAQTPAPTSQTDTSGAQSDASAPAEHQDESSKGAGDEMPNTASPLVLIALVGAGSLGAGVAAQRFSKRSGKQ